MGHPIKRDHARFRKVVKGKFGITSGNTFQAEMPHPKGDGSYKYPASYRNPKIQVWRKATGGVGQGEGKPGDPIDGQEG